MRILLIDDHVLFLRGLQFLLVDLDEKIVCVSVTSIAQALVQRGPFDLILLDFSLPDNHGTAGLERVRGAHEGVPVVMLSGEIRTGVIRDLVSRGAAGFISKSSDTMELLTALRTILAGGIYLPPHVLLPAPPEIDAPATLLTRRQNEVLIRLMQGKSNKLIATELDIGENTVKTHVAAAFKILDVSNRTEAVFRAATLGLALALDTPNGRVNTL